MNAYIEGVNIYVRCTSDESRVSTNSSDHSDVRFVPVTGYAGGVENPIDN